MKACYVVSPEKVEIKNIEKPVIDEKEVLIRVHYAGVCGSDLHLFHGTHPFRKPPEILGHEVVGEIVEIGSKVTDLRIGDRVTVEPHLGCGQCELCQSGNENLCRTKIAPGSAKWMGTFVNYFKAPASKTHRLADKVPDEIGVLIEPFAVAVHAINLISIPQRESIVILGSGTIGLFTVVAAKAAGFKTIIATDTQQFNRDMAMQFGANITLDPLNCDVAEEVKKVTDGKGADVAIVAAGASNIIDQASSSVRKRGEVVLVAMITEKIPVYSYSFVFNEQKLIGAMTYRPQDFKEAVDLVNNGLNLDGFVTQIFPIHQTQEALDTLAQKKENVVKVLVDFHKE
ncbi:zinc-dependent alcohol dehydrogenase [Murdochiella vaginalis]|uniref:zinc-dependent alcohol dehydrogenase n=1 Tax=Murdochiella vaginalis TaxID=1852373 RepID=UPI0008FE2CBA|nr:alcohol dehydrogenase catalytic domain-containing protein [Murdochiella vaginalis]